MHTFRSIRLITAIAIATMACSPPPGESASLLSIVDPVPDRVRLERGTEIEGSLVFPMSSSASQGGERFEVITTTGLSVSAHRILPAGSRIRGIVDEAIPATSHGGEAVLILDFVEIAVPGGGVEPIFARLTGLAESESLSSAATSVGHWPAAESTDRRLSGEIVRGPHGSSIVMGSDGRQVVLPQGCRLTIQLLEPVEVAGSR